VSKLIIPFFMATKPEAGDDSYSCMHDQGLLPALREGGDITLLVCHINKRKDFNDHSLTKAIQEEQKAQGNNNNNNKERHPIKGQEG
jgi:hypothetical protein